MSGDSPPQPSHLVVVVGDGLWWNGLIAVLCLLALWTCRRRADSDGRVEPLHEAGLTTSCVVGVYGTLLGSPIQGLRCLLYRLPRRLQVVLLDEFPRLGDVRLDRAADRLVALALLLRNACRFSG